jgi:hypothetical protein
MLSNLEASQVLTSSWSMWNHIKVLPPRQLIPGPVFEFTKAILYYPPSILLYHSFHHLKRSVLTPPCESPVLWYIEQKEFSLSATMSTTK